MTVYYSGPLGWTTLHGLKWDNIPRLTPTVQLTTDDILVWFDVISEEQIKFLVENNGIPGHIISTAHADQFVDFCKVSHWPYFLLTASQVLQPGSGSHDHLPVEYCANFLINKKRISRFLLLKLVKWFNLTSYNYTRSGIGDIHDLSRLLPEFEQLPLNIISDKSKFKTHVLSAVEQIPVKFQHSPGMGFDNVSVSNTGTYTWAWDNFAGKIVSQSAVSLITESIGYEKYMVYTEKTLYAVCGLTFPIWVGGYKQAETWAKKGFDTFDDVINHDYQYCDTLLERCVRAIADNMKILTDLNFAREQKIKHLDRLRKNRELLIPIFTEQHQNFWKTAPKDLIEAVPPYLRLPSK
jgi:hypothetical protein